MLRAVLKYGAIKTKISAMRARLLAKEDYDAMCGMTEVAEVVRYLKNARGYSSPFSGYDETTAHRADIEGILDDNILNIYKKIYVFLNGSDRKFFSHLFLRYEIEQLKRILRSLETNDKRVDFIDRQKFFYDHSSVEFEKLLSSNSIREFVENLRGTIYYDLLSPFLDNTEHLNLFSIEMTLDTCYFGSVYKNVQKILDRNNKGVVERTFGYEMDMLNLIWIYRCKKYYQIPQEIVYTYILPYKSKIKKETIKELVDALSVDEMIQIAIHKTPYGALFLNLNDKFIEENFDRMLYKINRFMSQKQPYSIATVTCYNRFLDIERENIITIVEGIRYRLPSNEIRGHLRFDVE